MPESTDITEPWINSFPYTNISMITYKLGTEEIIITLNKQLYSIMK